METANDNCRVIAFFLTRWLGIAVGLTIGPVGSHLAGSHGVATAVAAVVFGAAVVGALWTREPAPGYASDD